MPSYKGVAVFRDGVHYGVDKNGDPDLDKPLRVADDGTFRDAVDGEPLHNDVHHAVEAELPVGGEN